MDLIAKEFRYLSICYNNFTKPASTSNTSNSNENVNELNLIKLQNSYQRVY